jgi:hypothetical protein
MVAVEADGVAVAFTLDGLAAEEDAEDLTVLRVWMLCASLLGCTPAIALLPDSKLCLGLWTMPPL